MTTRIWLLLTLVVVSPCWAQEGDLTRIGSRRWPTGTLAFSEPGSLGACVAELNQSGQTGSVCAKGARFWINNGAQVRVTDRSRDAATVTILDGPHAGARVVVGADELDPSGQPRAPRPARTDLDAKRRAAAKAEDAEAKAEDARMRAAGLARARCEEMCLGNPFQASNLSRCEDSCRANYQRRVK
jgi:hypothetical protein